MGEDVVEEVGGGDGGGDGGEVGDGCAEVEGDEVGGEGGVKAFDDLSECGGCGLEGLSVALGGEDDVVWGGVDVGVDGVKDGLSQPVNALAVLRGDGYGDGGVGLTCWG